MSLRPLLDGEFERYVKGLLSRAFIDGDKFFTLAEVAKYRPAEDSSIWDQRNNRSAQVVEVYRKGEFVCDVDTNMTRDGIVNKVWSIVKPRIDRERKERGEK